MTPQVAARGSSFKGAGLYYLHDKEAKTSNRVSWTQTRNLHTNDPHKAINYMAYTAMHAEQIKEMNGTSRVGRKSSLGPVYTYSLSWHPEDNLTREEMEKAADSSLKKLGLENYEAVIVCHTDRKHPHIHIICNLVDPQTGRTKVLWNDQTELSEWAQKHDKAHNRDHCPQRIINNEKRSKKEFVKYRGKEQTDAGMIRDLYEATKTGEAFRDRLEENGYTLAQGNKGRVVLVAQDGNITALSRQLKGQRARDIKAKLYDVSFKELPVAKDLAFDRKSFDRDKYNMAQEDKMLDAAMKAAKEKKAFDPASGKSSNSTSNKTKVNQGSDLKTDDPVQPGTDINHLEKKWKFDAFESKRRGKLETHITEYYKRDDQLRQITALEKKIEKLGVLGKITGKLKSLQEDKTALEMTLADTDQRIAEARGKLEKEIEAARKQKFPEGYSFDDSGKKRNWSKHFNDQYIKSVDQFTKGRGSKGRSPDKGHEVGLEP